MNSNFCLDLDTHYYNCSGNQGQQAGKSESLRLSQPLALHSHHAQLCRGLGRGALAVQDWRVLSPDMVLLGSQSFLLKHTDTSPSTSRICQPGKFKETADLRG